MIAKAMKRGLAGAMYSCGAALLEAGHSGLALSSFAGAARFEPSDPDYHYAVALAARDAGDRDRAVRHCERALELAPDMEVASDLLFAMFLHGEGYFELLGRIHRHLAPRTYVEIGIEAGSSLKLVAPQTRARSASTPTRRFSSRCRRTCASSPRRAMNSSPSATWAQSWAACRLISPSSTACITSSSRCAIS
jgi:hypothetical protein